MTTTEQVRVRSLADAAGHIAAMAAFMSMALQADPDTSIVGEAVEGLSMSARRVSDQLLELAGPES